MKCTRKAPLGKHDIIDSGDALRLSAGEVIAKLNSSQSGLTSKEAGKRKEIFGSNEVGAKIKRSVALELLSRLKNPLIIILLIAGSVSGFLGEVVNALIIFLMVFVSAVLSFLQQHKAEKAAEELKKRITTTATVIRNNAKKEISFSELVPGDIIYLSAGDIIPADARVVSSKNFFIDQSALTGESAPVEKNPEIVRTNGELPITGWSNYLFMGTSVVSGTATAVIVRTGASTEYGEIVRKTAEKKPKTEFEKGLGRFGFLIMRVTMLLVVFVFLVQALRRVSILESLLFAIALAVGLTPELLPMIISIDLSKGAVAMSKKGVIVKRLESIENFGSMDTLCTDKTGTLTENKLKLILHVNGEGKNDENVFLYSYINSRYQTGLSNLFDRAIVAHEKANIKSYLKVDEIPFDFVRKRSSIVVDHNNERMIISKGAPEQIFSVCSHYELKGKRLSLAQRAREKIREEFNRLSSQGYVVLGVSCKNVRKEKKEYSVKDESDMVFLGLIAFMDPPKETVKESIQQLKNSGIDLKILTGDNELVTKKICEEIGFEVKGIVLGSKIAEMNDQALARIVEKANIFARLTPAQKNRIIDALKSNGHVVGFLGDGINDAPSMRVADVSISVENAVDVAKESADMILSQKDLTVLQLGVLEGRKTFGNTIKYVMIGLSSNFGNMFSAAGASLFLNFLPMLPVQILLNNLLYDVSQTTIPTDNVDEEYTKKPKKLDTKFIRNFMIFFGPISSVFDFLTFFVMLWVFHASPALFQTAWFIESLCTQSLIIFVIRTRKPFWKSMPSRYLLLSTIGVVCLALIIPFTVIGKFFKFVAPPLAFLLILIGFVAVYLIMTEIMKRWFYRKYALD